VELADFIPSEYLDKVLGGGEPSNKPLKLPVGRGRPPAA
jgi:hypothetical protein